MLQDIKPCMLTGVHIWPVEMSVTHIGQPRDTPSHPKGATIDLEWWNVRTKKYEARRLTVSRERGRQFQQELAIAEGMR